MSLQNLFVSHKARKLKLYLVILVFALLAVVLVIFYLWRHYQAAPQNSLSAEQKETAALVEEVSKIMELPMGETPMVATVLDKEKVKAQPFFLKAENGDKLLAFVKSMTAILYRPSSHKIIQVAPITVDKNNTSTEINQAASPLPSLVE